tara:strand:- start:179 stop:538 length:360 start_codon:yes stop_codon:yes gene_type:complete
MKNLLLLTLFIPVAYSNHMDNMCEVHIYPLPEKANSSGGTPWMKIEFQIQDLGCQRNNILIVDVDQEAVAGFGGGLEDFFTWTTAKFCRFDRAIEKGDTQMTCVLHDTKQRDNLRPNGY